MIYIIYDNLLLLNYLFQFILCNLFFLYQIKRLQNAIRQFVVQHCMHIIFSAIYIYMYIKMYKPLR